MAREVRAESRPFAQRPHTVKQATVNSRLQWQELALVEGEHTFHFLVLEHRYRSWVIQVRQAMVRLILVIELVQVRLQKGVDRQNMHVLWVGLPLEVVSNDIDHLT